LGACLLEHRMYTDFELVSNYLTSSPRQEGSLEIIPSLGYWKYPRGDRRLDVANNKKSNADRFRTLCSFHSRNSLCSIVLFLPSRSPSVQTGQHRWRALPIYRLDKSALIAVYTRRLSSDRYIVTSRSATNQETRYWKIFITLPWLPRIFLQRIIFSFENQFSSSSLRSGVQTDLSLCYEKKEIRISPLWITLTNYGYVLRLRIHHPR